jgi:hypothetical protein
LSTTCQQLTTNLDQLDLETLAQALQATLETVETTQQEPLRQTEQTNSVSQQRRDAFLASSDLGILSKYCIYCWDELCMLYFECHYEYSAMVVGARIGY